MRWGLDPTKSPRKTNPGWLTRMLSKFSKWLVDGCHLVVTGILGGKPNLIQLPNRSFFEPNGRMEKSWRPVIYQPFLKSFLHDLVNAIWQPTSHISFSHIRKQCRWCPWGIIKHIGGSSYTWRNGSANPLVFMRLEWWIFLSTQFRRFDLRTHSLPCESHLSCRVPPTIRREFLPYHRLHPREIPEQSHDDLVVHDFSVEFRRSWKPLNNQKGRERTMQKRQVLLLNWKVEPKTLEHKTTPPPGSWKEKRTQELGPTNSTFRTWIFQKSDVCVGCLALFALFDLPKMGTI